MNIIETDVLVVGSGAAGLAASVYAANEGVRVLVCDKGVIGKSGSTVGAVQITASGKWTSEGDSKEAYIEDILASGQGLSDPILANELAEKLEGILDDLSLWGLRIDTDEQGKAALDTASGHRYPRSISAKKGNTGLGLLQTLAKRAKKMSHIELLDDVITVRLLKAGDRAAGALVYDLKTNRFQAIRCKSVIIAAGGAGQLYPVTTNPIQATGDGYSLALQAGAELIEMEQIQFYPVSVVSPRSLEGFCLSFYHIGKLYNQRQERFMERYEPTKLENVTRDRLAFYIAKEVKEGRGSRNGGVWLDGMEIADRIKKTYPHEYQLCYQYQIDLEKAPVEVAPAAHFVMGGVKANRYAASSVEGLYAAGEAAGGLHGANRLGNNALAECVVFGSIAGKSAAEYAKSHPLRPYDANEAALWVHAYHQRLSQSEGIGRPFQLKRQIRQVMSEHVGVLRCTEDLRKAHSKLNLMKEQLDQVYLVGANEPFSRDVLDYFELEHMIWLAQAVVGSALLRKESRGAHMMLDYPETLRERMHTLVTYKHSALTFKTEETGVESTC